MKLPDWIGLPFPPTNGCNQIPLKDRQTAGCPSLKLILVSAPPRPRAANGSCRPIFTGDLPLGRQGCEAGEAATARGTGGGALQRLAAEPGDPGSPVRHPPEKRNEVATVLGADHAHAWPSEPRAAPAEPALTVSRGARVPGVLPVGRCSEPRGDCCAGPAAAIRTHHRSALGASNCFWDPFTRGALCLQHPLEVGSTDPWVHSRLSFRGFWPYRLCV